MDSPVNDKDVTSSASDVASVLDKVVPGPGSVSWSLTGSVSRTGDTTCVTDDVDKSPSPVETIVVARTVTVCVSGGSAISCVLTAVVVTTMDRPGTTILRRAICVGFEHEATKSTSCLTLASSRATRVTVTKLSPKALVLPQIFESRHICKVQSDGEDICIRASILRVHR